jgi:hypothetical protein
MDGEISSGGEAAGERIAPLNAARTVQRAIPTYARSKRPTLFESLPNFVR